MAIASTEELRPVSDTRKRRPPPISADGIPSAKRS
jgi:hypothetical protein